MRIISENGSCFLEAEGRRVAMSREELSLFRKLNPMGRKVHMRRKAILALEANPSDPDAVLMLNLASLPAKRWAFVIPAASTSEDP